MDLLPSEAGLAEELKDLLNSVRSSLPLQGIKHDEDKPRTDLLCPRVLLEVSEVLAHGARKYGAENWREVPALRKRYVGAALRHVFAYMKDEPFDQESGLSHLAHAICSLMFVLSDEVTPR